MIFPKIQRLFSKLLHPVSPPAPNPFRFVLLPHLSLSRLNWGGCAFGSWGEAVHIGVLYVFDTKQLLYSKETEIDFFPMIRMRV